MEEEKKKIISEYMRELAKRSHAKSPRSKEFYSKIGKMEHRRGKQKQS